jgi:hypothetical protein
VPVRPGYYRRQRYSRGVCGHMAFAAVFSPGQRGSSLPLPVPEALWSCTRRRSAMTIGCPRLPGMPQARSSIKPERIPLRSRTGNTGVPRLKNPGMRVSRSTGCRYAIQRKPLLKPCGGSSAACLPPVSSDSPGSNPAPSGAAKARQHSKRRRLFPMNVLVSSFPSFFFYRRVPLSYLGISPYSLS